jgi:lipopolysaccharide/colanic/teichoic acid biosynthesis glycosyltransferase
MRNTSTNTYSTFEQFVYQASKTLDRQWGILQAALVGVDALCVIAGLTLAYLIRLDGWLFGWTYNFTKQPSVYAMLIATSVPMWLALNSLIGVYKRDNLMGGMVEYKQILKSCAAGILGLIVISFVIAREDNFDLSRGWIALSWLLTSLFLLTARFCCRRIAYAMRERGWLTSRVLIVGASDQGIAIARQWLQTPRSGMNVVGFLDDFKAIGSTVVNNLKVLGSGASLQNIAHEYQVNEVVVISGATMWDTFNELVTRHHVNDHYILRLSPGFYETLTSGMAVTNKTFVPLLTLHTSRIVGAEAAMKRFFDFVLTLLAIVLTAPLLGATALWLRRRNPRQPILQRTAVMSVQGKAFDMFRLNLSGDGSANRMTHEDKRIRDWLASAGWDKLPQLWNVLRGEMSLVGPRPRCAGTVLSDHNGMQNLLIMKPGVIGPWLIHDATTSSDSEQDEINYVRNWEIWRDLPIMAHALSNFVSHSLKVRPIFDNKTMTRSNDRIQPISDDNFA